MGRSLFRALAVATATLVVGAVVVQPASAGNFTQTWNTSANYRASNDFIPDGYTLNPQGKACVGQATGFYIRVVRTAGSVVVWSSSYAPADGGWWWWPGVDVVQPSTAYYFRWRGLDAWENPGPSSPCQGVSGGWNTGVFAATIEGARPATELKRPTAK